MKPKIIQTQEDGWIPVNETWVYASANTITVPTGAVSRYQKGDKIKWTQTTVKYGVIIAVADTLITIAINTDYVVTNAAISAVSISRIENPFGFPAYFNFTPVITAATGTYTSTSAIFVYTIIKSVVTINARIIITAIGTGTGMISVTLPVAPVAYFAMSGFEVAAVGMALSVFVTSGLLAILKYDGSNASGNNYSYLLGGSYII